MLVSTQECLEQRCPKLDDVVLFTVLRHTIRVEIEWRFYVHLQSTQGSWLAIYLSMDTLLLAYINW